MEAETDENVTIWLSLDNYSIHSLPPEPNPLSRRLTTINFGIPPLFWNENVTKKVNIFKYRSKRLKYYDPQLYNIKFTRDGEPNNIYRNYYRVCQPTGRQPLAFNILEKREIDYRVLIFAFNNPENPNMPRIIDWMEYRNVWYLACEFICIGCMLPFQWYDLEDNRNHVCPRCGQDKYVIHNELNMINPNHISLVPDPYRYPQTCEVWPAIKCRPRILVNNVNNVNDVNLEI